ncbi:DUF6585 family protein [Streptomyces sp. NPDC048290]|uniref:DUF6585 family protein n=1 Tax=Streptomyces sp. NPDC048290 TaxID=3155811 RepID=UPI00343F0659
MPDQSATAVPPQMRNAARDFELGSRRGTVHTEPRRLVWGVLVPLVLFGAFMLWFAVRSALEDQRTDGAWYYSAPLLLLGLGPLVLAGWIVVRSWSAPQIWVGHYEHGVIRWVTGRVPEVYEWDEIADITRQDTKVSNGMVGATHRTLTVTPVEGAPIEMSDAFSGFVRFADDLDTAFTQRRLRQDTARLQAGERVDYFLVQLDPEGIGYRDRHLAWREVERVEVKQDYLHVRQIGAEQPWLSIPASPISTLGVFLSLAERLRRQHRPGRRSS